MTIRHLDLRQTVLIHNIDLFNDAVPVKQKGGQSVDIVWGEILL